MREEQEVRNRKTDEATLRFMLNKMSHAVSGWRKWAAESRPDSDTMKLTLEETMADMRVDMQSGREMMSSEDIYHPISPSMSPSPHHLPTPLDANPRLLKPEDMKLHVRLQAELAAMNAALEERDRIEAEEAAIWSEEQALLRDQLDAALSAMQTHDELQALQAELESQERRAADAKACEEMRALEREHYQLAAEDDAGVLLFAGIEGGKAREYCRAERQKREVQAAKVIQGGLRGMVASKQVGLMRERFDNVEMADSAAVIQANCQGLSTRRQVPEELRAVADEAAQRVQGGMRGDQARSVVNPAVEELQQESAARAQAGLNGQRARQSVSAEVVAVDQAAAARSQAGLQGMADRRFCAHTRNAVEYAGAAGVQAGLVGMNARCTTEKDLDEYHNTSAARIQAETIGLDDRRDVHALREEIEAQSAEFLQGSVQGHLDRVRCSAQRNSIEGESAARLQAVVLGSKACRDVDAAKRQFFEAKQEKAKKISRVIMREAQEATAAMARDSLIVKRLTDAEEDKKTKLHAIRQETERIKLGRRLERSERLQELRAQRREDAKAKLGLGNDPASLQASPGLGGGNLDPLVYCSVHDSPPDSINITSVGRSPNSMANRMPSPGQQRVSTCPCGNGFLDDSLFCRKCGAPRPEDGGYDEATGYSYGESQPPRVARVSNATRHAYISKHIEQHSEPVDIKRPNKVQTKLPK